MIRRFCLYSIFKNLRFFEHFFVLYLLAPPPVGAGLSFLAIGSLVGYQKGITLLLEVPSGFVADQWSRRGSLALTFGLYAVAFPLYGIASQAGGSTQLLLLVGAQTLFGVGEAFRTGTHKAMLLEWAEGQPGAGTAVRVIGITRFWSKLASGVSALAGGMIVWLTGTFAALFWLAAVPAILGIPLVLGYPRHLDGAGSGPGAGMPSILDRRRWTALWAAPGVVLLFFQSVLFESQIKLGQHYLQPLLQEGLGMREITVAGGIGALLIGVYFLVQDGLGGVASRMASRLRERAGSEDRILGVVHLLAGVASAAVAGALFGNAFLAGAAGFLILVVLQNLRRPVFVARFDRVMDRRQRAASLSIESQARTLLVAILAPLTGWVADVRGLAWVFAGLAALAILTVALGRLGSGPPGDRRSPTA